MKTAGRWLIVLSLLSALYGASCPPPLKPGDPLRGLSAAELQRFERGRAAFARVFTPETGLGPLFNADGCAECHEDPAVGGSGDEVEVHRALLRPDGFCDPLADRGGPVFQQHATPALQAALGIDHEPEPAESTARAARSTPDVFGFGLLEAVPDSEIIAYADPDDRDGDGISGRPNFSLDGRLGRFGRKAFVPTLKEFVEGAYVIEQGITDPAVPTEESIGGRPIPAGVDTVPEPEIGQEELDLTEDFTRFLAAPQPLPLGGEGQRGRAIFEKIGCASCHLPSLTTGDSPVRALRYQRVYAYTDLLLHNMGAERADICFGQALPSEFRTEPLMGAHLMKTFLHDGAAKSIEEAVELHGGEAAAAKARFDGLPKGERAALLKFLNSL